MRCFWDLLQSAGGIVTDPSIKNDILCKIIVVTGTNQILVAYEDNSQRLGSEGPAQIVAPGDKAGRFVHNIASIVVKDGSQ